MNFLKNLFGGGRGSSDDRGIYFYVQPRRCTSIARIRIDPFNDLSENDGGDLFVRKEVRVAGCPFPAELRVQFDRNRNVVETVCDAGELVTKEVYEAWAAAQG